MTEPERTILINASKDESGFITTYRIMGGEWCIETGDWKMTLKGREAAKWKEALRMLVSLGYIESLSKDVLDLYELTERGWNKTDELINQENDLQRD